MVRFLILFAIVVGFVTGHPPPGREEGVNAVSELSNQLASDLHKILATEDGNVFFSPLSISSALAMVFYGARGNTAQEMRQALGFAKASLTDQEVHASFQQLLETFSADSSREYLLYVANAILTQKYYPIRPEYKAGLQRIYQATARDVDFLHEGVKVAKEINDWVKLKTNNQIDKLLDKVDPSTIMVLLNAVYFKGTWKTQFDPEVTSNRVFFNKGLNSQETKVPTMHLVEDLLYGRVPGLQVLELPYKGEDISMVIVLPDERRGLVGLEQQLHPNTLRDLRAIVGKTKVHVSLPKFKLQYESTLNDVLQDLGIKNIFNSSSADLSGISETGLISLSKVIHKAVVEVNEEGSEASAITGGIVTGMIPGLPQPRFIADHPFLFAIVHRRSDMILFQGRVNEL